MTTEATDIVTWYFLSADVQVQFNRAYTNDYAVAAVTHWLLVSMTVQSSFNSLNICTFIHHYYSQVTG
jgi:hypothetical protein